MKYFKSHRGAMLLAVIVIALSVLFGFHRSASAARAEVEALFYTGADGSGYSIASDLEQRRAAAKNLMTVASRYLDADGPEIQALDEAVAELFAAPGPAEKYAADQKLETRAQRLLEVLADRPLSEKDESYAQGLRAELAGRADSIRRDPYNQRVDQFNQAVLGTFPGSLLKHIASVRDAEAFRP